MADYSENLGEQGLLNQDSCNVLPSENNVMVFYS